MPEQKQPSQQISTMSKYEDGIANALWKFGFTDLRPLQTEVIEKALEGKDVLGIMSTGSGKTACFQIPGVVKRLKTVVVSPLIALQDDQVASLRDAGVNAHAVHSGLSDAQINAIELYYSNNKNKQASFLYVSPEMMLSKKFRKMFGHVKFDTMVVDEAHCVSTWGNTFRPEYQRLRVAAKSYDIPQVLAFTATVDARITDDIMQRVARKDKEMVRIEGSPYRDNLHLSVENVTGRKKKLYKMFELMQDENFDGPIIVYCRSRNGTAILYQHLIKARAFLRKTGYTPLLYHAKLPYEDKDEALRTFLDMSKKPIVFATTAFGMGIDRPDVRQVIHYDTPFTLVDYAQQFGRAGRDGEPSLCTTFHSVLDFEEREIRRVDRDVPTYDFVEKIFLRLRKVLHKMSDVARRDYSISAFTQTITKLVNNNERIKSKELYLRKVSTTIGMLISNGLIVEGENGMEVTPIIPGSAAHTKLLEATAAFQRKEVREINRVGEFFSDQKPDQKLLWELISKK